MRSVVRLFNRKEGSKVNPLKECGRVGKPCIFKQPDVFFYCKGD